MSISTVRPARAGINLGSGFLSRLWLAAGCVARDAVVRCLSPHPGRRRPVGPIICSAAGGAWRVRVTDFDASCVVERDDDLLTRLRTVRRGADGAFVLDHGGPESLWVHI